MINNTNEIVLQNLGLIECIIKEFVKEAIELEQQKKLTITSIEKIAGKTIFELIGIVLSIAGSLLSNIVVEKRMKGDMFLSAEDSHTI